MLTQFRIEIAEGEQTQEGEFKGRCPRTMSLPSPALEEVVESLHIFCSQEATHQFAQLLPQNTSHTTSLAKGCPTFSLGTMDQCLNTGAISTGATEKANTPRAALSAERAEGMGA